MVAHPRTSQDTAPVGTLPRERARACLHCASPVPEGSSIPDYCCRGCEAVHSLLVDEGLGRYYALAGSQTAPVA